MDIRLYEPADRDALLMFAAEYGLQWGHDAALFQWKYERALPEEHATDAPRLWLVGEGDRVLGVFGAQPVTLLVEGEHVPAAYAMDVHLHAELRGKGFGGRLLEAFETAYATRLMPFSTEVAHGMYLHRGYREVPGLVRHMSVARTARAVLRASAQQLRVGPRWRRPPALLPRLDLIENQIPGSHVETSESLIELAPFLNAVQSRYAVCPIRSVDTLRWRYLEHPFQGAGVLSIRGAGNKITGVFGVAWCGAGGLNALVLADLYLRENDDETGRRIVRGLSRAARQLGADLVAMVALSTDLKSMPGFDRSSPLRYAVSAPPGVLHPEIDPSSWYLTAGDSDQIT
ncbi:MAG: GNAT family N-acetyltransferase [bacterium]|nr:GNAT family N-acetyltransferase [bacterium]